MVLREVKFSQENGRLKVMTPEISLPNGDILRAKDFGLSYFTFIFTD